MTVERRPRQFLAVWSDDGKSVKGSTFEESFYVDGAFWKNETSNVALDGFAEFGTMFSTELQAQHDALATELIEAHKTAITELQTVLDASNALVKSLQERLLKLFSELPFNPRIIDASKFYERITKDEFASLSVSDDSTLRTIAKTILAYKTNDWPVVFESQEFQGLIGYLVGTEFLSAERAAELTKDASRSEAYDAD